MSTFHGEFQPTYYVDAYRYAAERLCHRIRNPLTKSAALLLRLHNLSRNVTDPLARNDLTGIYAELQSLFERIGRVVEFDVGDGYFEWQAVPIGEWLEGTSALFSGRYGLAQLSLQGPIDARRSSIRANAFLLENAFGNLWANSVQAVEEGTCLITIDLQIKKGMVEVLLRDNGPGFSADQAETAFRLPFSTKSATRGRGLMEVADAVSRLQGSVKLIESSSGEYRILLKLPLDKS